MYVRNGGYTRLLSGDVYHSGEITASTDLQVGPVGIVLPLRGESECCRPLSRPLLLYFSTMQLLIRYVV